jgi:AcrR family transcriptional regulator
MARKTDRPHRREESFDADRLADRLVDAALALAAQEGWDAVDLPALARRSGVALGLVYGFYDDPLDILAVWMRRVDRRVKEAVGEPDPDTSARERLFDVLMERFEVLNADRAGALAIYSSLRADPRRVAAGLACLARSMVRMLDAAGVDSRGWRGALAVAGLVALWVRVSSVWVEDESPDLGRTMAVLDRALEQAQGAVDFAQRLTPSDRPRTP